MSQISMTAEERIRALARFGYTGTEARFLCTAGLHGGYFLRRQYAEFLGRQDGGTVGQLIEKVLDLGHAHASTYGGKTQVYHLSARPFYAALGQSDNRNRRRREMSTIRNKLMGLDFVLTHREHQYLATEGEKVAYFTEVLQVPLAKLPAKRYGAPAEGQTARYFVEKYPIFLTDSPAAADSPPVTFCFVDEGLQTLSHFETYLAQYRALFGSLPVFHLIYVAASEAHFKAAERAFERRAINSLAGQNAGTSEAQLRRLRDHFEARLLYEGRQFTAFDRQKLIRLRNDLAEFSGDENEALYQHWKSTGELSSTGTVTAHDHPQVQIRGTFSTCRLEHRYDFLGALCGIDDEYLKAV